MNHRFTSALLGLALLAPSGSTARGEELERELLKRAPDMVRTLTEGGYANVGVLKFRVKVGNGPLSDNVGTLNSFLAERLEVALVLANREKAGSQSLVVIRNASETAADIDGADHTTAPGREKLFGGRFTPAWGDKANKIAADAFVTGLVVVSPDLRDMTVGLLYFDENSDRLKGLARFRAPVDLDTLAELGESFTLRGAFDGGELDLAEKTGLEDARKVRTQNQPHPLRSNDSPVTLEVRYDGRAVGIEHRGGAAFVPEPNEGQDVSILVRRNPGETRRLGIVLKVNGENTLFRERKRDLSCRKWILDPGVKQVLVRGYQKSNETIERFRVLSKTESEQREIDYGADVGMIQLTVYPERSDDEPEPMLLDEQEEDLLALMTADFPEDADNLRSLQRGLRTRARGGDGTRGLIGEGTEDKGEIRIVEFEPSSTPVMTTSVRYYKPRGR